MATSGLLDVQWPSSTSKRPHPISAQAANLKAQVVELRTQGLTQADIARQLGGSRQTVSKHLRSE